MINRTRLFPTGFAAFAALALALAAGSCDRAPILVGFIAPSTGPSANIGVEGLKGLTFAVAERNLAGGAAGRRVEVVARDDRADPDATLAALEELVADGIRLVVLHTTSAAGAKAVEWAAGRDVLLLTHTMADPRYGGRDDNLIRFESDSGVFGRSLGTFAAGKGVRTLVAAYDSRNGSYARAMIEGFKAGAPAVAILETRELPPDWSHAELAAEAIGREADALLLLAPGLDAAKTAQALASGDYRGLLLLSAWSQDQNLLTYSGVFGERIFFPSSFNPDDASPGYRAFRERYRGVYGEDPVMSSMYAVDLALFLFKGLEAARTDQPSKLKRVMLDLPIYEGLQYPLQLDAYGDSRAEYRILTVGTGEFRDTGYDAPRSVR